MKREAILQHEFVDFIPSILNEGTIYISIQYATTSHNCCCGCGFRVVTPLAPAGGWTLAFDGESISLDPSIGNWDFPCRSHYFIRRNRVVWASRLSRKQIEEGRAFDRAERERSYTATDSDSPDVRRPAGLREMLKRWLK